MYDKESYLKLTHIVCINITCIEILCHFNSLYLTITQLSRNDRINVTNKFYTMWTEVKSKCWVKYASKTKMRSEDIHLVWTDYRVHLLLEGARGFKIKKTYVGADWEIIKDKFENIRETFVSNLAKQRYCEECAHSAYVFTRKRIASKILEEQSGGGRIIATFYDLCNKRWSGSPRRESIQAGWETVENLKTSVNEDIVWPLTSLHFIIFLKKVWCAWPEPTHRANICSWNIRWTFPWYIPGIFWESSL